MAMAIEPEREKERVQHIFLRIRSCEPHILLECPPGQQPRFLEYDAEPAGIGEPDAPFIVPVEPCDDAQQRGLATARGTNQRTDLAAAEPQRQRVEYPKRFPRGGAKGFLLDVDVKPSWGASG